MNKTLFVFLIFFSSLAHASQTFKSEFSHFSGGLVMTLLAAYALVRFAKKHRSKAISWAFWFSTIFVSIAQTRDYLRNGRIYPEAMDFFWHTVGTILAAFILYKLIKPSDKNDAPSN